MNMDSYSICQTSLSVDELSKLLQLFAEPTRLKILFTLGKNEHCVSDCQCHLPGVSQSLLSHHLADLRKADVVKTNKQGLRVYYSLTDRGQDVLSAISKLTNKEETMNKCSCQTCACQSCAC